MTRLLPSLLLLLACGIRVFAGPSEDALRVGEEALAKKDYVSALTTFVNAYNERASAGTANDETCAKLLQNAGLLMAQTSNNKDAVTCFENLLKLRTQLSGVEHAETARVKSLLSAQIANAGGDLERAETMARDAATLFAKGGPEQVEDHMMALTNLAGILLRKKDRLAANEMYVALVHLGEEQPHKRHDLVAGAFTGMATIAEFFGRNKDQAQYLKRSAELTAQHYGKNDPNTYLARLDQAQAASNSGQNKEAAAVYEGIIADLLAMGGAAAQNKLLMQRWTLAEYRLAYLKFALNDRDGGFALLKSSLERAKAGFGETNGNLLPIYLDLAKQHLQRKNYQEGVRCYQRVLDIRRRELGPDHADTKETQRILNELAEDVKRAAGR